MRHSVPSHRARRLVMCFGAWLLVLGSLSGDLARGASIAPVTAPSSLIRSAGNGPWSAPTTWEGGAVPTAGATVQVRAGHTIRYDITSDEVIRSIHVAGTLSFAGDRDTRLTVGLIKIQSGDDASEDGFDCDAHMDEPVVGAPRPALEVGTADRPIGPGHSSVIRLSYVEGMDPQTCPSIVCCGGRMDFHGAPMSRTRGQARCHGPGGGLPDHPRRAGHGLAGR